MQRLEIPHGGANVSHSLLRTAIVARLTTIIFNLFLGVTVLVLFIPFNPRMPASGLDASWEFAMNEAVARHMAFGRDIVFTYGPYASICTQNYHPATNGRMMWGCLLVAMSFLAALLFLSKGRKRFPILFLMLFLATFKNAEIQLLSYSFLIVICVVRAMSSNEIDSALLRNWRLVSVVVVMWSTLGLLPLIKGSLLLPIAVSVTLPPVLLLCRGRIKPAFFLFAVPVTAAVTFWSMAGQSLANLPMYVRGAVALTSGYTEAMSTSWAVLPSAIGEGLVLTFLAVSATMFWSIIRSSRLTTAGKWALIILCLVFLFVAFKHGFIATSAISSTFCSSAIFFLIIGFVYVDRFLIWSVSIMILLTCVTSIMRDPVLTEEVHEKFGVYSTWSGGNRNDILKFCLDRAASAYSRVTYKSTWNTYKGAWDGLQERVSETNSLAIRFERAKAEIRNPYTLPALKGTADFYENDQSVLLASNNEWDPRPVIQSYSSYTPALAKLNELHLRGASAPEWVLFDLQSIGGRLPSLDDGLSWPALLDNYSFVSFDGQFLLMSKDSVVHGSSEYDWIQTETCKTGAVIALPNMDGPLFAEVELKPTLVGRLAIALFNPPQLRIALGLGDGTSRSYRVISEMMSTGFLVSPLVSNTEEVASLVAGSNLPKRNPRVDTISIAPSYGGTVFWSGTYTLTLKRYIRQ
jgi:hypothetical protein